MNRDQIEWLLTSDEPWTRYRTLVDLLDRPPDDPEVQAARRQMVAHPQVQTLVQTANTWPGYALKRHNDARHPLYAFTVLADFGLCPGDLDLSTGLEQVLAHQSPEGAFRTRMHLYKQFGGHEGEYWVWMACDAPTLLYVLLAMGLDGDTRVRRAVEHLVSLVQDNGWRCAACPELGNFKGPGRKDDPCPIANVYALKALAQVPELRTGSAVQQGAEMLLSHWADPRKLYLFGIGTDFRKLKYPFVWYDILHVVDVLSRYPFVYEDPRFQAMVATITGQPGDAGRYTAGSMYRAWKEWSFANKKHPSPWLTFLVLRLLKRTGGVEK
jgi:hypothetical protein